MDIQLDDIGNGILCAHRAIPQSLIYTYLLIKMSASLNISEYTRTVTLNFVQQLQTCLLETMARLIRGYLGYMASRHATATRVRSRNANFRVCRADGESAMPSQP